MRTSQITSCKLIERPIYGSSRLGIDNTQLELIGYTAPTGGITTYELGLKQYELTNHLGNVLSTVSDKKIPHTTNGTDIDYYLADITSASDYYPFGSPMSGRTFSSDKYRFGFNGKEKDDEIKGEGNSLDFGARIYDSRLGRWLACDPYQMEYTAWSPYNNSLNNPILYKDEKGEKPKVTVVWNEDKTKATIKITNYLYVYSSGKESPEPLSAEEIKQHLPNGAFFLKNGNENVEVNIAIETVVENVEDEKAAKAKIRANGGFGVIVNNSSESGSSYHQKKGNYDYIELHPGGNLAHELGHDLGFADKYVKVFFGKLAFAFNLIPYQNNLMCNGDKLTRDEQKMILTHIIQYNSLKVTGGYPIIYKKDRVKKGDEVRATSSEPGLKGEFNIKINNNDGTPTGNVLPDKDPTKKESNNEK